MSLGANTRRMASRACLPPCDCGATSPTCWAAVGPPAPPEETARIPFASHETTRVNFACENIRWPKNHPSRRLHRPCSRSRASTCIAISASNEIRLANIIPEQFSRHFRNIQQASCACAQISCAFDALIISNLHSVTRSVHNLQQNNRKVLYEYDVKPVLGDDGRRVPQVKETGRCCPRIDLGHDCVGDDDYLFVCEWCDGDIHEFRRHMVGVKLPW